MVFLTLKVGPSFYPLTFSGHKVFNFDQRGVVVDLDSRWEPCICVPVNCNLSDQEWAQALRKHTENEKAR